MPYIESITKALAALLQLLRELSGLDSLNRETRVSLAGKTNSIQEALTVIEQEEEAHFKKLDRLIKAEPTECSRIYFLNRKIISLFAPSPNRPSQPTWQERRMLRIALAGETSAGKTTMLNTIFGTNLFFVTQGEATGVLTEISYDPLLTVETLDHQGRIRERLAAKPDWFIDEGFTTLKEEYITLFKDFIATHTKAPGTDRGLVRKVRVQLPLPFLPPNILLLDTPGFNSRGTDPSITVEALAECHVCLFLIDARNALKSREMEVLQKIHRQVSQTFIVLNKMDLVLGDDDLDCDGLRAAEDTLARVQGVLAKHFDHRVMVFPVCSAPRQDIPQEAEEYADNLATLFQYVFREIKHRRTEFMVRHLLGQVLTQAALINRLAAQSVAQYEKELELLLRQTPQPLSRYEAGIWEQVQDGIKYHSNKYSQRILTCIEEEKTNAEDSFLVLIHNIADQRALEKDAQSLIEKLLGRAMNNISAIRREGLAEIAQAINQDLMSALERTYRNFPFKARFKSANMLAILTGLICLDKGREETDLAKALQDVDCGMVSQDSSGAPVSISVMNSVGLLLGGAIGKYMAGSTLEYSKQKLSQIFLAASAKLWENAADFCTADLNKTLPNSFVSHLNRAVQQQLSLFGDIINGELAGYRAKSLETEETVLAVKNTATAITAKLAELEAMRDTDSPPASHFKPGEVKRRS